MLLLDDEDSVALRLRVDIALGDGGCHGLCRFRGLKVQLRALIRP